MNFKTFLGKKAIPGWLFSLFTIVYCEAWLHIWITEAIVPGRLLGILAFALGFGSLFGFLLSFGSGKPASKWIHTAVIGLISAFYLVEFFVSDAYKTFMPVATLFTGAGGVVRDFGGIVVTLVTKDAWRIGIIMLPTVLYALLAKPVPVSRRTQLRLFAGILAGYLGGYAIVWGVGLDVNRFSTAYNFDSAIRTLGLNIGMTLDVFRGGHQEDNVSFETLDYAFPETEPTAAPADREPVPQETEVVETEPAIVYEDNVMDIDFDRLIADSGNANITAIHQYVASLTPTKQNAYTGLFEGKNLILITAEAFTKEVIDPERTPTLYRLATKGIQFNDYYQPAWGGSTTTGEYSNLMGLVPTNAGESMLETLEQKMFLTMGHQLKKLDYYSTAYHNHNHDFYSRNLTHMKLGYDRFLALYGGLEGITAAFPESDLQMIDITVPQYIDQQPFSIYYMTVSGHSVYTMQNHMSNKNYAAVADMDASEPVKCYYAANMELEYAMASLVRQLEEAGIADDTVIVIATDHYPYGLEKSSAWENSTNYLPELYGVDKVDLFVRDHNALIIWSGSIEDQNIVVDTPVYSLDILPTVSNLFGVDYDSRLLVGRDVFSDAMPLVLWPDHSWKTDRGTYNSVTGEFIPNEGYEEDPAYTKYVSSLVANKISFSKSVQTMNYYHYVLPEVE